VVDSANKTTKKAYLSQSDVPKYSLQESLKVPRALADQYGKQPASPLDVAVVLEYGLTDGGPRTPHIGLTELGRRIVAPTEDGDDKRAMREALLRPRVVGEFLSRYSGAKLPAKHIGQNVLETMGVPADATERTFDLIVSSARTLGLLREIKGDEYVNLDAVRSEGAPDDPPLPPEGEEQSEPPGEESPGLDNAHTAAPPADELKTNRKVFITHGKNKKIVEQLKELLAFGEFEAVVSVERESVSKPVPTKVLDDMRSCSAAVIHVGVEQRLIDSKGEEHGVLNPNVLIEIGAAMMRYGNNFVLLVEDGTELPSNLQGLYEVRYTGDELDNPSTMKLLKAFNEFKA
jgi:hypothetical protein